MTPSEREPSATSEVFPCPFCGCEGVIVEIDGAWIAGCDAGQVRLEDDPTCRANAIGFYHKTREGAIAAWNRRVDGLPARPSLARITSERLETLRAFALEDRDSGGCEQVILELLGEIDALNALRAALTTLLGAVRPLLVLRRGDSQDWDALAAAEQAARKEIIL